MNQHLQALMHDLGSTDDKTRLQALQSLLQATETQVDWVYEAWDALLEKLDEANSYQRSIGILLLCNLAKSDSKNRLNQDLDCLLRHTKDEKFIVSRQCFQNIWKTATNPPNRKKIVAHLELRFAECVDEKHYNLLRQDILHSLLSLAKIEDDDTLLTKARALIALEQNPKYQRQYEALFKKG